MVTTEQPSLMTDSASVDSQGIVYSKRSVILTRGIAAIHNAALCVHSLWFILPPGSFLIIFLPSLLCKSSVKRHKTRENINLSRSGLNFSVPCSHLLVS